MRGRWFNKKQFTGDVVNSVLARKTFDNHR